MKIQKVTKKQPDYPERLLNIASPPRELFYIGAPLDDLAQRPAVAIVGSRKVSPYGRQVTEELARSLAERGIPIISGLAMGVDGLAHQAVLAAGGRAIAVLPSGLDRIYPASNHHIAQQILEHGGTLVSEYPPGTEPFKQNFIARNRIIAGLANAVLIPEAADKSGSLHTANFALEQGRDVLAVPGNITSPLSGGTNNLIKSGATPVTSIQDVLQQLNIVPEKQGRRELVAANEEELVILKLLTSGITEGAELLAQSSLDTKTFHQTLTMLEITSRIKSSGNDTWMLL